MLTDGGLVRRYGSRMPVTETERAHTCGAPTKSSHASRTVPLFARARCPQQRESEHRDVANVQHRPPVDRLVPGGHVGYERRRVVRPAVATGTANQVVSLMPTN